MNMKRRLFNMTGMALLPLLCALLFMVLTGCDDPNGGGTNNNGGGDSALTGTIHISTSSGGTAVSGSVNANTLLYAVYSGSETGITYQWNKDAAAVSGAVNQTFTPSAAGSYTVTVSAAGYQSKTSAAVTVPSTYTIGSIGPGGGKIFYVSETGFTIYTSASDLTGILCHYLEAAPADMPTAREWASSSYQSTSIGGTETAIGSGRLNTALILATDSGAPAALACKNLSTGGKSDWFLPSKDELNQLYINRSSVGNLGTGNYWSSSQLDDVYSWYQSFSSGYQSNYTKSYTFAVRAVRAF